MVTTITDLQNSNPTGGETSTLGAVATAASKRGPASSLKAEVYANVRDALRYVYTWSLSSIYLQFFDGCMSL
jgi:hypothetical protein